MGKRIGSRVMVLIVVVLTLMLAACQAPQPTPAPPPPAVPATTAPTAVPATQAPTGAPATKAGTVAPATQAPASASPTTQAVAPTKPATLQKVRINYSALTAFQALIWVAKDKGFFEKYGLDADLGSMANTQQIAAVTAGQVDIGQTSCDNPASAILSGADLKEFAVFVPYIEGRFYGRPEIKTAADLKGKVLGVSTAGPGIQRRATEYALQKLGLEPNKDVELRVFNSTVDAFAAAKSGQIQGIALFPPDTLTAEKSGFNLLYDVAKDRVLYPTSCMYATNKYLKEHADVIDSYLRALGDGIMVYKTDREFAINTFLKWTKTDDRAVAKAGIDVFADDMPIIPKWWPEPMKVILDALSFQVDKAKTTDPTSLYDNSFIEKLEKEGFYAQLQKQYPTAK